MYKDLPDTPGVYFMRDRRGRVLYIGKAGNLKRRLSSYFMRPHERRIEKLVEKIADIGIQKTDSVLEALILESRLIKRYQPPYNIREKDDKTFLYVAVTKEDFPRVLLIRGKELESSGAAGYRKVFGPFISGGSAREALKILRKIFPWNDHKDISEKTKGKMCFNAQIGLCPGVCAGKMKKSEYAKTIRNLILFMSGEKRELIRNLEKEMKGKSMKLEYEKAETLKRQIFALRHIQDSALISSDELRNESLKSKIQVKRVEGYDVSNISGEHAVGGMVVFLSRGGDGKLLESAKREYRKFKIKAAEGRTDDVGMLKEVLERRFSHKEWSFPDLVFVDGGVAQTNAAAKVLKENGLSIPVVGIAKGPTRRKNEFVGSMPKWADKRALIRVRDEAHRFAISFHRKRRHDTFIERRQK